METNMILSASGWRKVFAISGEEQDKTTMIGETNIAISVFASLVFSEYVKEKTGKKEPEIILGMDARPTGNAICEAAVKTFCKCGVKLQFLGITAAPEIMAYSKAFDGFMYVSASHNPVGHNGIKFGLSSGGVLNAKENAYLVEKFNALCAQENARKEAFKYLENADENLLSSIYKSQEKYKQAALLSYKNFLLNTITGSEDSGEQKKIISRIQEGIKNRKLGIVCDFNGSARTISVDKKFFDDFGLNFYAINDVPGRIVHEIIPESENLVHVAAEMERLQKEGKTDAVLGYMPDCDGDRGNIVYWDENQKKAVILKAQEVFSLSVLSELAYQTWTEKKNIAVAVNCPTSMRIDEICKSFGASLFRAEVGEANVVNLAAEKRSEGFDVRIFGEGSNGGTITYPSAVRDPINTLFAFIKLLSIRELYSIWCKKSGTAEKENYTLTDVLASIPEYTTTGVSEKEAVLHIQDKNHAELKGRFQKLFEASWETKKAGLQKYGIEGWISAITKGTAERKEVKDFSESGKGGLKIIFLDKEKLPVGFFWMRGSGTEPVFRIMADVKGNNRQLERELLAWETELLKEADR